MSEVVFQTCPLYINTFSAHAANNPVIAEKVKEFRRVKAENPLQNFGAKDYPMGSAGPIGIAVPKIRHAHLTSDISIFYTLNGRDPTIIRLYGLFTHAESGTGQPANIKKQKSLGQQLSNQSF